MTTLPPLDPALTYFVGVDHGAGPDTTKAALVNVEPDGKVVVIGEADNTIAGRVALLRALSQSQTAPASPPALTYDDIRSMARLEPAPVIVSIDTMRQLCEPDSDAERMLMVKANAVGGAPIWRREAQLRAMFERGEVTLPAADPPLAAALAAFDVPGNHKKNRAQRRKEARRGG